MSALAATLWLRRADRVGGGTQLEGRPSISNAGQLIIGARLRLVSVPVQSHLVVARGGELVIGDDVAIGHGAAIAAHARIRIGPGTRIGPFVSISDTDFHVAGQRDAEPQKTPVDIGRDVRIGSRVTILRGAVIGDGARVLAGSVVSGDVAPGSTVGGVPARPTGIADVAVDLAVPDGVAATVALALGLEAPPALSTALADIEGWDSLGALRLLLGLEERFGVTLDDRGVPKARRVSDLVTIVEAVLAARHA